MKFLLKILVLLLVFQTTISNAQKKVVVELTYLQPYCGGARPTPEMEKEAHTPKPYANKKVFFISEKGKVDSITTNEKGHYKIKLKSGTYKVYEAWRFRKLTPENLPIIQFNKECLESEWGKEFQALTVSRFSFKKEDKNEIVNYCDYNLPCQLESFRPPLRK